MAVIDEEYRRLEKSLIKKHGSLKETPEDDQTLMKIRVKYFGWSYEKANKKAKNKEGTDLSHIKRYEPEKTMLLNENAIRKFAERNGVPLADFGRLIGKRPNYLNGLMTIGFTKVEMVEQIAYWLGVEREEIIDGEQVKKRQPQIDFDKKKVTDYMAQKNYKIEDLESYLYVRTNIVRMALVKGRGPAYVVKSLCDMAGIGYQEE